MKKSKNKNGGVKMKKLVVIAMAVFVVVSMASLEAVAQSGEETSYEMSNSGALQRLLEVPVIAIDSALGTMQNVRFEKPKNRNPEMLMPSPLAIELSHAEDCDAASIIWAINIVDSALGMAGLEAVVYPNNTQALAQSLILLADVANVTEKKLHTHIALEQLTERLADALAQQYANGFSSGMSGNLLAEDVFNFARNEMIDLLNVNDNVGRRVKTSD